jgi:thermitase
MKRTTFSPSFISNFVFIAIALLTASAISVFNVQRVFSEGAPLDLTSKAVVVKPNHAPDRILVKMRTTNFSKQMTVDPVLGRKMAVEAAAAKIQSTGMKLGSFTNGKSFRPLDSEGRNLSVAIDLEKETVESAIARVSQHPDVEYAQPDFIYRNFAVPNDSQYELLWGLKNTGQTIPVQHLQHSRYSVSSGTSGRDMSLESAWDKVTDCSTVVVAVIDTGINLQHSDLADNLWNDGTGAHGYDFVNEDNDPQDDEGHGTHVAGTIGARGNNSSGTTGICWRAKLMAVKVLDADGTGLTSDIIEGVNYAVAKGAHIINMSLGGGSFDASFKLAVKSASDANVLVVVAAGNSGVNAGSTYPCAFEVENLICVGAVDQKYSIASFSNYSPTLVHIGAPGTNIVSATLGPIVTETMTLDSGWSMTGEWGASATTPTYLQIPQNYDGSTKYYSKNKSSALFRTFTFFTTLKAYFTFTYNSALVSPSDLLEVYLSNASITDPSLTAENLIASYSGIASSKTRTLELADCGLSYCTVGFLLKSNDDDKQSFGVQITDVSLVKYQSGTSGYDTLNGTSMAAPHVAGLAALIKSYNPNFTTSEIREAILKSGTKISSLKSYFREGSVANAADALKYLPKPAAPAVAIQ